MADLYDCDFDFDDYFKYEPHEYEPYYEDPTEDSLAMQFMMMNADIEHENMHYDSLAMQFMLMDADIEHERMMDPWEENMAERFRDIELESCPDYHVKNKKTKKNKSLPTTTTKSTQQVKSNIAEKSSEAEANKILPKQDVKPPAVRFSNGSTIKPEIKPATKEFRNQSKEENLKK